MPMTTKNNYCDQKQQPMYLQGSQNAKIMQKSSIEGSQSFEFEDFSQQMGSMSEDQISGQHLMEVRWNILWHIIEMNKQKDNVDFLQEIN